MGDGSTGSLSELQCSDQRRQGSLVISRDQRAWRLHWASVYSIWFVLSEFWRASHFSSRLAQVAAPVSQYEPVHHRRFHRTHVPLNSGWPPANGLNQLVYLPGRPPHPRITHLPMRHCCKRSTSFAFAWLLIEDVNWISRALRDTAMVWCTNHF